MLLTLRLNLDGSAPPSQTETLFARMWADGTKARKQEPPAVEAPKAAEQQAERFPAPRESTPAEMAGYTAMAAALVKAEVSARLAEQMAREAEQRAIAETARLLAEARDREEQNELELLLLLL